MKVFTRNIEIRQMTREDIPAICKADNDDLHFSVSLPLRNSVVKLLS